MPTIRIANRIILIAFLISLVVHLAPVSFLYFDPSRKNPEPKSKPEIYDVELLDSAKSDVPKNAAIVTKAPPQPNSKPVRDLPREILSGSFQKESLKKYFVDHSGFDTDIAIASGGEGEAEEETDFPADPISRVKASTHGWSGAVQYGNAMGLQFTLESLAFFQALHRRIDALLVYPDDISRQRITGKVRIEAEIARDGRLIRFTSTVADDRILQTYCFAVLMQILSQPLPQHTWLDTPKSIVAFDFEFHTRIHGNIPRILPKTVEKNRLAFGRENEIDPWLNEKLTEIFTHYIPPIIPLPGGFYVDFVLAYQYVNNLVNGAPTEQEKREQRLSTLHQLLRMTLRQTGMEPGPSPTPLPEG